MDFLDPNELYKYEDLIETINEEYKKCEELKRQLSNENNKIIIYNLSTSELTHKISHVGIKVFSNILDLLTLYQDELNIEMKQFNRYTNHKFYLIQVYITKAVLEKISSMNCILNISIKHEETCINKSMKITTNSPTPLLEIIAVNEKVIDCTVETTLLTDQSMTIKLDEVFVDISYHFQVYDKKKKLISGMHPILQIAKRYNEDLALKELNEKLISNYELTCNFDAREFISIIMNNSYHQLGSDLFTESINSGKNEFTIHLSNGMNKCEILFKDSKMYLRATVENISMLKKYFRSVIYQSSVTCDDDEKLLTIQTLKTTIPLRIQDAKQYYKKLRKCWSTLCIK